MEQTNSEERKMEQQTKEETKETEKLLCPKAGTATSAPMNKTTSTAKCLFADMQKRRIRTKFFFTYVQKEFIGNLGY
jgi:hypothetical protein